jgi:hypothetical protein
LKKNNGVLIGGNIGKNKLTPNEEALWDYEICFDAMLGLFCGKCQICAWDKELTDCFKRCRIRI